MIWLGIAAGVAALMFLAALAVGLCRAAASGEKWEQARRYWDGGNGDHS